MENHGGFDCLFRQWAAPRTAVLVGVCNAPDGAGDIVVLSSTFGAEVDQYAGDKQIITLEACKGRLTTFSLKNVFHFKESSADR